MCLKTWFQLHWLPRARAAFAADEICLSLKIMLYMWAIAKHRAKAAAANCNRACASGFSSFFSLSLQRFPIRPRVKEIMHHRLNAVIIFQCGLLLTYRAKPVSASVCVCKREAKKMDRKMPYIHIACCFFAGREIRGEEMVKWEKLVFSCLIWLNEFVTFRWISAPQHRHRRETQSKTFFWSSSSHSANAIDLSESIPGGSCNTTSHSRYTAEALFHRRGSI